MGYDRIAMRRVGLVAMMIVLIPVIGLAQTPLGPGPRAPSVPQMYPPSPTNPPQAPVQPGPPGQPVQPQPVQPQPGQSQGGHPSEYAFRPDLSNPEFGRCLNLEKRWKALWQRYYQLYNQARMMNPNDRQYAQLTYYVQVVKQQLDAAWREFSGKCVYFPER